MPTCNLYYFNTYLLPRLSLIVVVGYFGLACNTQNTTKQSLPIANGIQISASAININRASAEELEKLPNIGKHRAQKIVEHREKFGRFRTPEQLLLVRGISDELFREVRAFIKVE